MISFLQGTVIEKKDSSNQGAYITLSVHGVGFQVLTSSRSVRELPEGDGPITLHTSLVVREDAMMMVGFANRAERDLFNILQSASGVGVKVALSILTELSVSEIVQAVISDDFKSLTAAKGVGPKLAQKMVLELREKMMGWRDSLTVDVLILDEETPKDVPEAFHEAESVLLSLGYTSSEVHKCLKSIYKGQSIDKLSSENVLQESLRWLATMAS